MLQSSCYWKSPNSKVLKHPKYIQPKKGEHFLWRDFYHEFDEEDFFQNSLKKGFKKMGFTPPHPSVGELDNKEENKQNRRNFAKFWSPTKTYANQQGWKVGTGSVVELYLSEGKGELASNVYITPMKVERFLIRITPKKGKVDELLQKIEILARQHELSPDVSKKTILRAEGKIEVVDIATSLFIVLGEETQEVLDIEKKLLNYVTYFLKVLEK